jgi:lysozyme
MNEIKLNEVAIRIAAKLVKLSEGCYLRAYADPASPLGEAIQAHNQWYAYLQGKWCVPKEWEKLSASPWTCGWGETQGVTKNTVYTQQDADTKLDKRVREFMAAAIKATPALATFSAEKQAAITSLVYNIGITNYIKYDISKRVQAKDHVGVYNKFRQYIIANGKPNDGLKNRRSREADLYASVTN